MTPIARTVCFISVAGFVAFTQLYRNNDLLPSDYDENNQSVQGKKISRHRFHKTREFKNENDFCPSDPIEIDCECVVMRSFFIPKRLTFSYVQGTGNKLHGTRKATGYGTDYGKFAALFASQYHPGRVLPMIDIRAEGFINNTYGFNVGVGGRYIPDADSFCALFGFNAFYDFRSGFKGPYSQFGLGMEILGKRWDFRANGYFPVGSKGHTNADCPLDSEGDVIHSKKYQSMPLNFNCELGFLAVDSENFLLYAAAGPYIFSKKNLKHIAGGEVRLRPQYKDYVALDLSVRYDSVFHTTYQAEIIFYWPLYQCSSKETKRIPCCGISERQIYQPIERFEVMPLYKRSCP